MSIKVNIENQVRQTTVLAWRPLLPLFEAIMNSFQAIKEAQLPPNIDGRISIKAVRRPDLLDSDAPPISTFVITDNGVGLDDDNWDSFNTAFSPHKLSRGGKGLGRFTWLKAFDHATVLSTFKTQEGLRSRAFNFDMKYESDDERGSAKPASQTYTGTTVELVDLKPQYTSECPRQPEQLIQRIIEHFILIFLEVDCPIVTLIDNGQKYNLNSIFEKEFKDAASEHTFIISDQKFMLHGFRLPSSRTTKHKLVYAADQRSVLSDKLEDHLPNLTGRLIDIDGNAFFYLGIVQGSYLSSHVNNNRTDFDFGNLDDAEIELPLADRDQLIPKADIRSKALAFVQEDLADVIETINSAKLDAIRRYVHRDAPQYRILLKNPERFLDKLTPQPQRQELEAVLHKELFLRETELKKESSRIIKEATKISDYSDYYKQFKKFLDEYNDLGASALAQYVAHRRIILDFLERAINIAPGKKNFPLEKVVHQLVFPMQATNEDIPTSQQNLWIIDERLTYHSFVSSDKKNSLIPVIECDDNQRGDIVALDENAMIFDEKIVFSDENRKGHPLSSIVVIEFKQPGRTAYKEMENPVLQAARVINAIRSGKYKHKGRKIPIANSEIPAMIFVVADLTDRLRDILTDFGATVTPDKQGFYGYHVNYKVYYEVVDYTKMLSDATKRNQHFFDKLNLVDNH